MQGSTCGGATIRRVGYTRRAHVRRPFTRKRNVDVKGSRVRKSSVKAARIPDVGAPGKWEDKNGPGIGKLKPGGLAKFGYATSKKNTARHRALRKAVHAHGPLSTFRKLQAVGIYTKRTSKRTSKHALADRDWVKKTFMM